MYVHSSTRLFIRHGIDVEIGLAMAIVTLVRPPATTRRCWQLWQTRITMLVYIVACSCSRTVVNIMRTEKREVRGRKIEATWNIKSQIRVTAERGWVGGGVIVEWKARQHEPCTHARFPVLLRAGDRLLSPATIRQDLNLSWFAKGMIGTFSKGLCCFLLVILQCNP